MLLNKAHDFSMVNPDGERSLYRVQDRTIIIVPAPDRLIIMGEFNVQVVATVVPGCDFQQFLYLLSEDMLHGCFFLINDVEQVL